jgi:two-component system, NtrC family, sensor kinase
MPVDLSVTRDLSGDTLARINRFVLVTSSVRGTVHTVNNLLQTIGGQAELLGQREDLPEDVLKRVERISAQTVRAAELMRELSALGREAPGAPDRTDVRRAIDRAYSLRQYDMGRAQIAVEFSGEPAGACVAAIDAQALMLAALNLLLNAEQALTERPGARVDVSVQKRDGAVVVAVQDNGPGIPAEHRDRIFEPFFTTGRAGATLGLGLTVARLLAAEHGGQLVLAGGAAPEVGARFEIRLPAAG